MVATVVGGRTVVDGGAALVVVLGRARVVVDERVVERELVELVVRAVVVWAAEVVDVDVELVVA